MNRGGGGGNLLSGLGSDDHGPCSGPRKGQGALCRAVSKTRGHPRAAVPRASRPMPRDAPVMMHTRPFMVQSSVRKK